MPLIFTKNELSTLDGLERVMQRVSLEFNEAAKPTPLPSLDKLARSLAPFIRGELQATGTSPLNLQSLLPLAASGAFPLQDTHANRLTLYPAANYDVGVGFYETDRTVLYIVALSAGVKIWQYVAGVMYAAFANRPTDLGTSDAGFELEVSDHLHRCRWGGTAWVILDNNAGTFVDSAVALGTGWQLCDGTATSYLAISGADLAQTAFTTPDENSGAAGVYHTSIAAYTGTINAAVAPATSGSTAATTATNIAAATGITIDNESAHTHAVTSPTGAPSATTTVDNTLAGSTVAVGSATHTHTITSPTGAGSAHTHTVTDPTHNHTQNSHTHGIGTIAVDATAQPRNMGVLRYFRR